MMFTKQAAVAIIVLFILGCRHTVQIDAIKKRYIKGPYLQEWTNNCIKVAGQLETPELIATAEFDENLCLPDSQWNRLVKSKRSPGTVSFRIRIEPVGKCIDTIYAHNSDIVYGFGRSETEREENILEYNFRLENRIWLNWNGTKIIPMFCHTEDNFGIDNGRDIWLGFSIDSTMIQNAGENEKVTLFFQKPLPFIDVVSLVWSTSLLKKINGGGLL